MNKHSILTKTTLFFVLLFICINSLMYFYQLNIKQNVVSLQANRYIKVLKALREHPFALNSKLSTVLAPFNIDIVLDENEKNKILFNGKLEHKDKFINIYTYENERYLKLIKPNFLNKKEPFLKSKYHNKYQNKELSYVDAFYKFMKEEDRKKGFGKDIIEELIILKDNSYELYFLNNLKNYTLIFTLAIDLLLIGFYIYLYRKIRPLKVLKDDIKEFAKGDLSICTSIKGKDEIALVANEFNQAILRIKELTESRNLFLRNIMHELKTPITKGRLISDTVENEKKKKILQKAFYRLEYLLEEFAKIEELTSGKIRLNKNEYILEELVNQAMDILLLDTTKLDIQMQKVLLNVDFDLFSIALKNLIDNAIKYNTNGNPEIFVTKDKIVIKNKGDKLKKEINEYFKPFNREYESISQGLGLGLYITNNIVKIHGFELQYEYKDQEHAFSIVFNS